MANHYHFKTVLSLVFSLIILLMLSSAGQSQTVHFSTSFARTQTVTNGHTNEFRGIETDTDGNTYVLIYLSHDQIFNGQTYNSGHLLIKYNLSGQIQWTKRNIDTGRGITLLLDHQGNPIVVGNRLVTTSQGWTESRLSIIKYAASDGSTTWENIATSGGGDMVQGATLSSDGGIYIIFSKASFNPYITWGAVNNFGFVSGATRNVILKADENGTPEWAKYITSDGTWNIEGSIDGICAGSNNEVYIVGKGTRLFPDAGTRGTFVSQINSDGAFSWFKRVSTSTDHSATDVIYHEGHIYVCGDVANQAYTSLDFGNGVNSADLNFQKGYVAKLAPDGTAQWLVTNTTGTMTTIGNGLRFSKLSALPNGNIVALANLKLQGVTFGGKVFNSTLSYGIFNQDDTMIFELDATGKLISSFATSGTNTKAQIISGTPDNTIWFGGTYAGSLTVGNQTLPQYGSSNDYNFFLARVTPEAIPLPVTLTKFEAKVEHNSAKLSWETASESNNKEFVISRSINGLDFTTIGKVKGNGNSAQINHYVFYDKEPLSGTNYYKLQQIDFDGKTTELGIKTLVFSLLASDLKVYPNPTTDNINLSFNAGQYNKLIVSTPTGNILLENNIFPSTSQLLISLEKYKKGIYIVHLKGELATKTIKIIKQ